MTHCVAAALLLCTFAGGEPQLAPPNLAPMLLHDGPEIERYVDAFPSAEYGIVESPRLPRDCPRRGWLLCVRIWWSTPYIGRFYVEPPPRDPIKHYMELGYVWEPHIVASIEEHVVSGSVAVDVGAYMGVHALLMGRLVGQAGRVYAFEPQRKMFRELRHNVRLNGLGDVVAPLRYALGEENAVVEMDAPRKGIYEGGVAVGAGGDRVEMRTLDSFGFENVSLIKIDVEGFEDAVLAGAAQTIRASKPVILIEILGRVDEATASAEQRQRIDATVSTIEAFGYRVHALPADAMWRATWRERHDYIALP